MGREIERKFLVDAAHWNPDPAAATPFIQGYLSLDPERVVRVRIEGDDGRLTIKGIPQGISRPEYEYPIPTGDARELLQLCIQPLIEKTRYHVQYGGMTWDVDEFHGLNAGLRVAEIELPSEDTPFDRPPWAGADVSEDPRYSNSSLVRNPYSLWRTAAPQGG